MRNRTFAVVAVAALAGCAPQLEQPRPGQAFTDRDFRVLTDIIAANTPYRNFTQPKIERISDAQADRLYPSKHLNAVSPTGANAFYVCETQTIYLPASTARRLDDGAVQAALAHELTHHAQCLAGKLTRPNCAAETEAYGVQVAFLNIARASAPPTVQVRADEIIGRLKAAVAVECGRLPAN